ncbi:hypothetical protein ACWDUN_18590 [Mycobacterium sp. NPDC003323]
MPPNADMMRDADRWFLRRGLPSALTTSARWRRVVPRSAPALVAWAVLMVLSLVATVASGGRDVAPDADPSPAQWLALLVLAAIPAAMVLAGYGVARLFGPRGRWAAAVIAVAVGVASDWYGDDTAAALTDTVTDLVIVALIVLATGTGIGSILGWSARVTLGQLRSAGRLMVRALPVVLLTVLVFFNGNVWSIAADLDALRMGLLVGFLALIATAFIVSGVVDALGPATAGAPTDPDEVDLAETPFAEMSERAEGGPLRFGERVNLVLVVTMSQVTQMVVLACVTGAVFFTLGLIVLNPAVSDKLTGGAPVQSVWFDMTLPVSVAHLHMTAFLTALTFMYVSVRAVGDGEYRREFLDPLLTEMELAIAARHRYHATIR